MIILTYGNGHNLFQIRFSTKRITDNDKLLKLQEQNVSRFKARSLFEHR